MPKIKVVTQSAIAARGVINENGTWGAGGSASHVAAIVDRTIDNCLLQIGGRFLTNKQVLRDVVITPLDVGGMIFLLVTVIAEIEPNTDDEEYLELIGATLTRMEEIGEFAKVEMEKTEDKNANE